MSVVEVMTRLKLSLALATTVALAGCAHGNRDLARVGPIGAPATSIAPLFAPSTTAAAAAPVAPAAAPAPAPASAQGPATGTTTAFATTIIPADDLHDGGLGKPSTFDPPPPVEPLVTSALAAPAAADNAADAGLKLTRLSSEEELALPPREDAAAAARSGRLPDILRHALADNPDVGIAAAQLEGERIAVDIARAGLQPTVSLRAGHGVENYHAAAATPADAVPRTEFGIDLHQTLYDFGRTNYDIARHKALQNSAGYRHLQKLNDIARDITGAYLRILEADEQIRAAEANVASHEDIETLVNAQQTGGNASVADVKRVTTRLEKARTGLIDLRSRKQSARDDFRGVAGFEPGALLPPPRLPSPLPPAAMSSDEYPDNPQLMSVRADVDSLRMQAGLAKSNLEPSIDLDLTTGVKDNVSGDTGETSDFKGMISFNYKLIDGDQRLNTARQIFARIEETKQVYRKKRREYVQALDTAIRTVRTNGQKSASLATRVADSRKVLELYKAQFKDGNKTLFELLDAQMDLYQAESEAIANRYETLQSTFEIYAQRGDLAARLLSEPH
jgi:adhesin transport system outer membrane protein